MEFVIGVIILSICVISYAYFHNSIVAPAVRKKKEAEARKKAQKILEKETRLREIEQAQIRRAQQREADAQKALAAAQAKKQAEVAAFKEKKSQPVLKSSQLQELNKQLRNLEVSPFPQVNQLANTLLEKVITQSVKAQEEIELRQLAKQKQAELRNGLPDVYFDKITGQWRVRE